MDSYFNEARMPFIILIVGQIFAMAHLTRALLFIAIVWLLPYYAIQAPTKMRTTSRRRTRRESIDSTISSSSTLVEPEFESAKVKFAPNNIVHEREVKTLSKKRSQVFTKISSSVAPVARRVSVPAKKVATKAHAKCNSIISGVHDHMHMPRPLPHVKRAYTMHISHPDSTFASSCTAVKKLARDSTKWHLPRKQATI